MAVLPPGGVNENVLKIVALIKYTPELVGDRRFADDFTVDRGAVPGRISELDEYTAEQAIQLAGVPARRRSPADRGTGPDATEALRKALSMGADKAVHVLDDALHGSDALATSLVLAKAVDKIGFDLVSAAWPRPTARMGVIPAMLAERLGVPQVTLLSQGVASGTGHVERRRPTPPPRPSRRRCRRWSRDRPVRRGPLPVVQGHHGGQEEAGRDLDLADLASTADEVGLRRVDAKVVSSSARPPRQAGKVVKDEGEGGVRLAELPGGQKFI